jgi:hypothetical protein
MKNLLNKSIKNVAITFGIFGLITTQIFAEGLFDSPSFFDTPSSDSGDNSFYKSDGSLVIRQFEYADKNQDAKLSFEESRQAVNGISQGQFIALDEDGDGLHSFEEIDQDIAYLDYQQFNQLDLNQDGKLNYAEAQRMFIIIIMEA